MVALDAEAKLRDSAKLTAPIKSIQDKYELLPAFLKVQQELRLRLAFSLHLKRLAQSSMNRRPDRPRNSLPFLLVAQKLRSLQTPLLHCFAFWYLVTVCRSAALPLLSPACV